MKIIRVVAAVIKAVNVFDDFSPLCGKGIYLLGQALAVVHDCL